ncbi:hypothetical protein HPP92_025480 [Vanilla planifolia]|uniref:Uncharacterized protein n=1 Tax=Vanilla planifolia TaxID=51239 RepID=A0A835PHZ5_VANPL|nr:hypothetical protein HPP92_025480 [Vanilla planifolia]
MDEAREEKRQEVETTGASSWMKREALSLTATLKEGLLYVKAFFTAQVKKLTARNEKEASEAGLQEARMQAISPIVTYVTALLEAWCLQEDHSMHYPVGRKQ